MRATGIMSKIAVVGKRAAFPGLKQAQLGPGAPNPTETSTPNPTGLNTGVQPHPVEINQMMQPFMMGMQMPGQGAATGGMGVAHNLANMGAQGPASEAADL